MLSRVAESIYWMSRYIERAENVARVVDVNVLLQLDLPDPDEQWDPIVRVTGDHAEFLARYGAATRTNVLEFLTFDTRNPNSILSSVTQARENARSVREIISSEMWEEVNAFYLALRDPGARDSALFQTHDFFREVKRTSHLIEGTKNETMPHGEAWHFSRMGRFMERADQTSRILDVKYFLLLPSSQDVGKPVDDLQWSALLRSASGFEAYRKAFGRVSASEVAAFLLFDREFPRSVYHCLAAAQESLGTVSGPAPRPASNHAERALGLLVAELHYADAVEVIATGLHEFIDRLQAQLNMVGNEIAQTFFAARPIPSSTLLP
jgi:uncharacterized alpha-E superfamily protein